MRRWCLHENNTIVGPKALMIHTKTEERIRTLLGNFLIIMPKKISFLEEECLASKNRLPCRWELSL